MARLFFALWPDAAALERLAPLAAELAASAGGKPVPARKIHLTLAFLGDVDEGRVAEALAADVGGRRFRIDFDSVGAFRGARVAWAGIAEPPPRLMELHSALAAGLGRRGFELEARPYAPHLTLARRISRPVARAAIDPIGWEAGEVTLVRSELGTGRYTRLETWSLRD